MHLKTLIELQAADLEDIMRWMFLAISEFLERPDKVWLKGLTVDYGESVW